MSRDRRRLWRAVLITALIAVCLAATLWYPVDYTRRSQALVGNTRWLGWPCVYLDFSRTESKCRWRCLVLNSAVTAMSSACALVSIKRRGARIGAFQFDLSLMLWCFVVLGVMLAIRPLDERIWAFATRMSTFMGRRQSAYGLHLAWKEATYPAEFYGTLREGAFFPSVLARIPTWVCLAAIIDTGAWCLRCATSYFATKIVARFRMSIR